MFTTDNVTIVETDIQLPYFFGNKELELTGLENITDGAHRLVHLHAEGDDEATENSSWL